MLLEAGGKDINPWIHIPVGYFKTMGNPKLDWCFRTEPDPGLNGRSLNWPRGKVLGGSSSLNGLLYVRGQPLDYDGWRQLGNRGWGWNDVKPLFKRAESFEGGADECRGNDGPLSVSYTRVKRQIVDAWIEASVNAGYPLARDYNSEDQEGVAYFQMTTRDGRRCSTAVAYLRPAAKRPNLTVLTGAHVNRLTLRDGQVTGVEIQRGGRIEEIVARREVVLAAGAIGSPHILMLSGIGPGEHLQSVGIQVLHDLPGVGATSRTTCRRGRYTSAPRPPSISRSTV